MRRHLERLNASPGLVAALLAVCLVVPTGRALDTAAPVLRSLEVVPETTSLEEGSTEILVAIGTDLNGARRDVTSRVKWSSSNRKLATVAADGTVTAMAQGKVTIRAVIGRFVSRVELTIRPRRSTPVMPTVAVVMHTSRISASAMPPEPPQPEPLSPEPAPPPARPPYLKSVTIEPATGELPERETQRLTAVGHYSDGTERDITTEAVWASSDVQVARAGLDGTVSGVRFGTVTIHGTLDTYSGVAAITITPIMVRMAIVPARLSLKHRGNSRLAAVGTWSDDSTRDLTGLATWTSSDEGIASVHAGSIQGMGPGSATISADLDDFHASAGVTVEPVIQALRVEPQSASLTVGQTQQLTATATYSDGSERDVTALARWSWSSPVVQVSGGLVTANAEGSATVNAWFDSLGAGAVVNVSKASQ
jgi:uncharacterized protein YjdB